MPVPVLKEVAQIAERSVLDLWGGELGQLPALYLSTGTRGGGNSKIFSLAQGAPVTAWVDENIRDGAETIGKIRDDGDRVYAFYETDGPNFIISRPIAGGPGGWSGEPLPGDDFVGGRGLLCLPDGTVYAGGAAEWNAGTRRGELYKGEHGSFGSPIRSLTPGILWECEVDDADAVWEFWHAVGESEAVAYRDGVVVAAPSSNVACAGAFGGAMYATGNQPIEEPSADVKRFTGSSWETVYTFPGEANGDHVIRINREPPELWAISQRTFQVAWSLDGNTWEPVVVPSIQTGSDTNQYTGVALFHRRVFVATRDTARGNIRIFADGVSSDDLHIQVI